MAEAMIFGASFVGLKAHAFTGTAEARRSETRGSSAVGVIVAKRKETGGSSAVARDCGHAVVARAQTGVSVPRHPTYPTYDVGYQRAEGSLGSSAAADSGCRLISRARLAMSATRVERDPSAPSGRSGCRCWSHRHFQRAFGSRPESGQGFLSHPSCQN
jgi:hypothetical protein